MPGRSVVGSQGCGTMMWLPCGGRKFQEMYWSSFRDVVVMARMGRMTEEMERHGWS